MTSKKKKEDVITEKRKKDDWGSPMIDTIAKITATDFDESGVFDCESAYTVLVCDLIFKMYLRGEYKEAMEVLAAAFLMANMEYQGELISVAATGYTDEKGKFYLDRFFKYSNICEIYELGRQIYSDEGDAYGKDDSSM